jgi:hypothetical protein
MLILIADTGTELTLGRLGQEKRKKIFRIRNREKRK